MKFSGPLSFDNVFMSAYPFSCGVCASNIYKMAFEYLKLHYKLWMSERIFLFKGN